MTILYGVVQPGALPAGGAALFRKISTGEAMQTHRRGTPATQDVTHSP